MPTAGSWALSRQRPARGLAQALPRDQVLGERDGVRTWTAECPGLPQSDQTSSSTGVRSQRPRRERSHFPRQHTGGPESCVRPADEEAVQRGGDRAWVARACPLGFPGASEKAGRPSGSARLDSRKGKCCRWLSVLGNLLRDTLATGRRSFRFQKKG